MSGKQKFYASNYRQRGIANPQAIPMDQSASTPPKNQFLKGDRWKAFFPLWKVENGFRSRERVTVDRVCWSNQAPRVEAEGEKEREREGETNSVVERKEAIRDFHRAKWFVSLM